MDVCFYHLCIYVAYVFFFKKWTSNYKQCVEEIITVTMQWALCPCGQNIRIYVLYTHTQNNHL